MPPQREQDRSALRSYLVLWYHNFVLEVEDKGVVLCLVGRYLGKDTSSDKVEGLGWWLMGMWKTDTDDMLVLCSGTVVKGWDKKRREDRGNWMMVLHLLGVLP